MNLKCCMGCDHYESETGFCRLNPPMPLVINNKKPKFISLFPLIKHPMRDYCSFYEANGNK